jgi:septum formation protein
VVPDAVVATDIDETPLKDELPRQAALRLARAKAAAAATPGAFVLAADTVVGVGRRILPKAASADEARTCLALLSGRRHHVWSAVVVVAPDGRRGERLTDSVVAFARLTAQQIETYLASGEWNAKAGGYAIQGRAAAHIRWLSGSYSAVVGLPLFETAQLLRGLGYPLP